MTTTIDDAALPTRILRVLGAESRFEWIVEGVLTRLRATLRVPAGLVDPRVEDEFDAARRRLLAFRAEFAAMEIRIFVRHVGEEHVADALAFLEDARSERWRQTRQAIEADEAREAQRLADAMRDVVLFGDSAS